ncbi:MAG: universal stress protein [Pirellulales bacterium]|nr:universal stress protein [Pirellulales bacterium]
MQLKKILFPTDFSHASDAGLPLATALARDTGATLVILHVEEPPLAYGGGELYYGIPEPNTEALQKMLAAVKPADPQVAYVHRMVTGDPATEIVRVANDERADIIVVGTHGRTGLTRLLMGSVAEQVIRRAACPVLTFKEPREAK